MITIDPIAWNRRLALAFALSVSLSSSARASEPGGARDRSPRPIVSDEAVPWSATQEGSVRAGIGKRPTSRSEEAPHPARILKTDLEPADVVAVLPIDGASAGIDRAGIDDLTGYLAARLTEVSGDRVVPRAEVHEALKEHQAASYRPRIDPGRQIEIGKALAAMKMLVTKIIRPAKICVMRPRCTISPRRRPRWPAPCGRAAPRLRSWTASIRSCSSSPPGGVRLIRLTSTLRSP